MGETLSEYQYIMMGREAMTAPLSFVSGTTNCTNGLKCANREIAYSVYLSPAQRLNLYPHRISGIVPFVK